VAQGGLGSGTASEGPWPSRFRVARAVLASQPEQARLSWVEAKRPAHEEQFVKVICDAHDRDSGLALKAAALLAHSRAKQHVLARPRRCGMERGPVVRGLLNLSPANIRRRRKPLRREGQKSGRLGVGLRPVPRVGELAGDPSEGVHHGEDGERGRC